MSSEIYYDRAYIRVGDRFIPVVNHGSSNCFDFDACGREVPEKHWSVLNYTFHGRQLFTEEEIRQIAAIYEAANSDNRDGIRKSRNRSFDVGEFGRWIMNGMKTAHTMEEYRACGNTVVVVEYAEPVWKKHVVYTTKQLLDKLCELDGKPISVSFWDNRTVMHAKLVHGSGYGAIQQVQRSIPNRKAPRRVLWKDSGEWDFLLRRMHLCSR